jgi:hypothetical protein
MSPSVDTSSLHKCDAWPVDDVLSYSSIAQVVRRLKDFNYNYTPQCNRCRGIDWETVVLKAQSNTLGYFNGMCLDCMDRSNPRGKDLDDEYEVCEVYQPSLLIQGTDSVVVA